MLLREVFIPLLAASGHPFSEGLTHQREDDVTDILSGHLPDLFHDGQGAGDCRIREPEVQDEVQREVLVLGDGNEFDVVAEDGLSKIMVKSPDLQFYPRT